MNTISALNNTAASTTATSTKTENTLGQNEFLTLLVAQLQNQVGGSQQAHTASGDTADIDGIGIP